MLTDKIPRLDGAVNAAKITLNPAFDIGDGACYFFLSEYLTSNGFGKISRENGFH
ncbi:MAG: hypothetical protein WA705_09955 [Candidatus Ozemobacteraceae bacterium]